MENSGPALLLLPPLPTILSTPTTKAVYGPAIEATLEYINRTRTHRLDIAIAAPSSWLDNQELSRTAVFKRAQKALAQTYSLICATATNQQIELDCQGGVDICVFFLLPASVIANKLKDQGSIWKSSSGPIVDLTALIGSRRGYRALFSVESKEGEALLKHFLTSYESEHQYSLPVQRVSGGLPADNPSDFGGSAMTSNPPHTSVAVGGTFDHLHIGHKLLLTATALLAEPKGSQRNPSQTALLTIGISGDALLTKKKYAEQMESWDERQQKVADFLESVTIFLAPSKLSRKVEHISKPGPNGKCVRVTFDSDMTIDYVEILDPFGPTITNEDISALVVSQETRSGGNAINEKRQKQGWTSLEVFEIDVLDANPGNEDPEDSTGPTAAFESKISSSEIRKHIYEKRNIER